MSETLYAKYTDYRNNRFRLLTRIIEEPDGTRSVTKESADGADAHEHLEAIVRTYGILCDLYGGTLNICPCRMEDGRVVFPYMEGTPFQEVLNEAMASGDTEQMRDALEAYTALLEGGANNTTEFTHSAAFEEIFGTVPEAEGQRALRIGNLDASGDNLLMDNAQQLTLVDYEWVLDFLVPRDFVVYRNVRVMYDAYWAHSVRFETLLDLCGITMDAEALRRMDEAFTNYVGAEPDGGWSRTRILMEHEMHFAPISHLYRRTEHFVFLDTGNGFSERQKLVFPARGNALALSIETTGVRALRFDPYGGARCMLKDASCTADSGAQLAMRPVAARTDGNKLFLENPANLHIAVPRGTKRVEIRAGAALLEDEKNRIAAQQALENEHERTAQLMAQLFERDERIAQLERELQGAHEEREQASGEARQLKSTIDDLRASRSWRYTKWLRSLHTALAPRR